MCTLILAHRHWQDWPLFVAANRDENLDRPAAPPELTGDKVFAPRDLKDGGTWLGINQSGLFVGLTNRFGLAPDHSRRSRGQLVTDLLDCTPDQALAQARAVVAADYNPFHLFVADENRLLRLCSDGTSVEAVFLDPGIHFLTERSLGAAPSQREDRLRQQLQQLDPKQPPSTQQLHQLLSQHAEPPFESLCVHMPEMNYGTRSTTLLQMNPEAKQLLFFFGDGPPCSTPLQDLSQQARLVFGG